MLACGEESALLCRVHLVHGSFDLMPWLALAGAHCEGVGAPLVGDSHRPTQVLSEVLLMGERFADTLTKTQANPTRTQRVSLRFG